MGVLTVSPLENPTTYNEIVIAGITFSQADGIVEVTGAERKFSWDNKQSAGSQGSTITYRGWALAEPKLKFKFWQASQINNFYSRIVPALAYDATKTDPKPFDVYHPKTFANDIFWLVTKNIGDLVDDGAQLWTVTVETLEYRQAKAKNATSTPNTASSAGAGGSNTATKPSATEALQRAIEAERLEFMKPS
jgi:hypothetical protein